MNHFKTCLALLLAICFAWSPLVSAQDAPPVPPEKSPRSKKMLERDSADSDEVDQPAKQEIKRQQDQDEKKKSDQDSDKEKSSNQPDMKSGDQQDEEKSEKKSDGDSKDKKDQDDKKDDKTQSDGKKDDGKKAGVKETANSIVSRITRGGRERERVQKFSKQSEPFVKIFEPIVASVNESTLQVMSGKRQIALGTVVDSNGLILTKASELKGTLGCKLKDGTILEAKVIGIDPDTDLALLKIDAENLNVAQWSDEPRPVTGRWLATPRASGDDGEELTIGIVSVDTREIPPSRPFIGIVMESVKDSGGVRITQVIPRSPADFADLWVNDVIKKIDEVEVKDNLAVRDTLGQYDVNDRITLSVQRGSKEMKIRLTLAERDKVSPENQRSNLQNSMGSTLSRRRKDFPLAFQHDSMLSNKNCGGPIVDLSGKIVGINIARAGRVSSLALPTDLVREKVELLRTGNLAPEVVNKAKIEEITSELEEMADKYSHLPDKKNVLERKYNVERARMEELNKSMADLRRRLKEIEVQATKHKEELKSVKNEIENVEKNRQRLEADREQLRTGSR